MKQLDQNIKVTVGGVPIAVEDETRHFMFIGQTGAGKPLATQEVIRKALARGDRAILTVLDSRIEHYYDADRGDVILSPHSEHSARWNAYAGIKTAEDLGQFAGNFIPDSHDATDNTGLKDARGLLRDIMGRQLEKNDRSIAELCRLIEKASDGELKEVVKDTGSESLFDTSNVGRLIEARAIVNFVTQAFEQMDDRAGPVVSVNEWVKADGAKSGRALILCHTFSDIDSPYLTSALTSEAMTEAMKRHVGDGRLWHVVSDPRLVPRIGSLPGGLQRLGKVGSRVIVEVPSIKQVERIYGEKDTQAIVNGCGNVLVLKNSADGDDNTARFAAGLIRDTGDIAVAPADLELNISHLAKGTGYFKTASSSSWRTVILDTALGDAGNAVRTGHSMGNIFGQAFEPGQLRGYALGRWQYMQPRSRRRVPIAR